MIVPPLATLLPDTTRQVGRDDAPLLGPVLPDKALDRGVLVGCPWSFHQRSLEDLLPSILAFLLAPVRQVLGNSLPVLGPVFIDDPAEDVVLWFW